MGRRHMQRSGHHVHLGVRRGDVERHAAGRVPRRGSAQHLFPRAEHHGAPFGRSSGHDGPAAVAGRLQRDGLGQLHHVHASRLGLPSQPRQPHGAPAQPRHLGAAQQRRHRSPRLVVAQAHPRARRERQPRARRQPRRDPRRPHRRGAGADGDRHSRHEHRTHHLHRGAAGGPVHHHRPVRHAAAERYVLVAVRRSDDAEPRRPGRARPLLGADVLLPRARGRPE
mmetsp:Transcript_41267/g.127445  ORF Transcript_41267/g.127445 Transcript_41267/m.127445 type:complete len:225 (-) Transcript_41267:4112-4786(-)